MPWRSPWPWRWRLGLDLGLEGWGLGVGLDLDMLALSTSLLGLRSEALYDRQAKKRVLLYFEVKTSSVAAGFGRHSMPSLVCNPDLWPFDLETTVWVASKFGNPHFQFGHASPLGSRIIRYVRDRQTDRQTDGQKQRLLPPYLRSEA